MLRRWSCSTMCKKKIPSLRVLCYWSWCILMVWSTYLQRLIYWLTHFLDPNYAYGRARPSLELAARVRSLLSRLAPAGWSERTFKFDPGNQRRKRRQDEYSWQRKMHTNGNGLEQHIQHPALSHLRLRCRTWLVLQSQA